MILRARYGFISVAVLATCASAFAACGGSDNAPSAAKATSTRAPRMAAKAGPRGRRRPRRRRRQRRAQRRGRRRVHEGQRLRDGRLRLHAPLRGGRELHAAQRRRHVRPDRQGELLHLDRRAEARRRVQARQVQHHRGPHPRLHREDEGRHARLHPEEPARVVRARVGRVDPEHDGRRHRRHRRVAPLRYRQGTGRRLSAARADPLRRGRGGRQRGLPHEAGRQRAHVSTSPTTSTRSSSPTCSSTRKTSSIRSPSSA